MNKKAIRRFKAILKKRLNVILSAAVVVMLFTVYQNCGSSQGTGATSTSGTATSAALSPSSNGSTLQISPATISLWTSSTYTFSASGGSGTYTFKIYSGLGTISSGSGLFTAPGSTGSTTVEVLDSNGDTSFANVTIQTSGSSGGTLTINPGSVTVAQSATQTFSATGGTGIYTYSIYAGSGAINASTGVYTAPAATGITYVEVKDSGGSTSYATVTIGSASSTSLAISPATVTVAPGGNTVFTASGGAGGYTFSIYENIGGSVNASTGYFTAPSTTGTLFVELADSSNNTIFATVTVSTGGTSSGTEVPVYRFVYSSSSIHFYTLSQSEGTNAGFTYEEVAFNVYSAATGASNMPIYRCDIVSSNHHYISTSSGCDGNRNEGAYGYINPVSASGNTPLYRLYNPNTGDYLETTNLSEAYSAESTGYQYQFTLGFVPTS